MVKTKKQKNLLCFPIIYSYNVSQIYVYHTPSYFVLFIVKITGSRMTYCRVYACCKISNNRIIKLYFIQYRYVHRDTGSMFGGYEESLAMWIIKPSSAFPSLLQLAVFVMWNIFLAHAFYALHLCKRAREVALNTQCELNLTSFHKYH